VRRPPEVYLVTNRLALPASSGRDALAELERLLCEAIEAGVDAIQIREGDLGARTLEAFARRIVAAAAGTGTLVLVNDRADVARAAGAAGVHLRGDGPDERRLRTWGGPGGPGSWVIGRSIHDPRETAAHPEVDYLMFGTVFPTTSKPAGSPVAGVDALRAAAAGSAAPVLAIGGITIETAGDCIRAGAAGVAGIGVFLPAGAAPGAVGPARAVRELRAAIGRAREREPR